MQRAGLLLPPLATLVPWSVSMEMNNSIRCALLCLGLGVSLGCTRHADHPATTVLRLATTTSTRDSGLLDRLLPVFEKAHNCRVDVVAVGTGAALKLGEAGDPDVLLVHARKAEEAFMQAKHGIRHEEFMFNYFTMV